MSIPRAVLSGVIVLALCPLTGADEPLALVKLDAIREQVACLDAADFRTRQRAEKALTDLGVAVAPALSLALEDNNLSLEQRLRIERIVVELLNFQVIGTYTDLGGVLFATGYRPRAFLVDNDWDYRRLLGLCLQPPEVDLRHRHLIVITYSHDRSRSLDKIRLDGGQLVVQIREEPQLAPNRDAKTGVIFATVAAFPGPVRFEISDAHRTRSHTVWGEDLRERRAEKQLQTIRRLCESGRPSTRGRIEANRPSWPPGTPDKVIAAGLVERPVSAAEVVKVLEVEFDKLLDLQARLAVPKVFAVADQLAAIDPVLLAPRRYLAAVGGPEVIAACLEAIDSGSPHAQELAIGTASTASLPEFRPVLRRAIVCPRGMLVRDGLIGLHALGLTREDIPHLLGVLRSADDLGADAADVVPTAITYLAQLKAREALPALRTLQQHSFAAVRIAAALAIAEIESVPDATP